MLESDGPGGAEVFLLHSAEELRNRGYDVVPVLPSWKTGWLGARFREKGFDPVDFTLERPIDPVGLRGLMESLQDRQVDVVHSHEFTMAIYGTLASRFLKKRHVITMHGNQWVMDARRRRVALRWAFKASDATVAVSEDTRVHLIENTGVPEGLVTTIPNGIPEPSASTEGPVREFGIGADEVVLLAVGNLTERKGHIVLLRALRRITEGGCSVPWRLIVAGEGPERERLEAFARESNLQDRIHLPGHRSDVDALQATAQVTVMPSLWEGLPLAVLEGMFAGNAIIGSSASGIPEAVRDEVDGYLVPPGDDQALATVIRRVLEDDALRRRLGASARERALDRFSIRRMMDDYERLYLGAGAQA